MACKFRGRRGRRAGRPAREAKQAAQEKARRVGRVFSPPGAAKTICVTRNALRSAFGNGDKIGRDAFETDDLRFSRLDAVSGRAGGPAAFDQFGDFALVGEQLRVQIQVLGMLAQVTEGLEMLVFRKVQVAKVFDFDPG